jgi:SAM-dependent methyltransferase
MEFHDVCKLFPMMGEDEYRALVEDIRQHGLREPIVVWQGKIVDGRNRYRACMELGIEPQYREWDGRGSLTAFVVSQNLHRRHLTASQRAVIALEIERMLAVEADERRAELGRQAKLQHGVNGPEGSPNIGGTFGNKDTEMQSKAVRNEAARQAADIVGVAHGYISDMKRVERDAPELVPLVRAGVITVPDAKLLARQSPELRGLALEFLENERCNTVKRAIDEAKRELVRAQFWAVPLETSDYRLLCGDLAQVHCEIADASVDVIITDPPYLREYLDTFELLARVAQRILKPGGSLVTFAPHIYFPEILQIMGRYLRYHWVLAYVQPGVSARVHARNALVGWKPIVWFTNGEIATHHYVYDVVYSNKRDKLHHAWGQSEGGIVTLVERFSDVGETVCDPFLGGGTTAVAAVKLGRKFIGIDRDADAIDMTRRRLSELVR